MNSTLATQSWHGCVCERTVSGWHGDDVLDYIDLSEQWECCLLLTARRAETYTQNLDKLVVYVDSRESFNNDSRNQTSKCGFVTAHNDALSKARLHVQCSRPLHGRYVYIEAWGVTSRWSRLYSAVLCEVIVYQWSPLTHAYVLLMKMDTGVLRSLTRLKPGAPIFGGPKIG